MSSELTENAIKIGDIVHIYNKDINPRFPNWTWRVFYIIPDNMPVTKNSIIGLIKVQLENNDYVQKEYVPAKMSWGKLQTHNIKINN